MHVELNHCRCQVEIEHSQKGLHSETQGHNPPASMEGSIQWETASRKKNEKVTLFMNVAQF